MKILCFADIHFSDITFPEEKPDIIFLLGDIERETILAIEQKYTCPIVGVHGNHDTSSIFKHTSVIDAHKKVLTVNGKTIAGFGGSPIYNDRSFGQYTEQEIYKFVKDIGTVDFFLAHSNPASDGVVSSLNDPHRGFATFSMYIDQFQPSFFLHGHLHKQKQTEIGRTRIFSVYPYFLIQI